jgi:type VI secretion system Hcp family effector
MKIFLLVPNVAGDATATGYVGQIECQSVLHHVLERRDPDTGGPIGLPVREPVQVKKAWDKSSLALATSMVNGTTFSSVTVTFVQETPSFGNKHLTIRFGTVRFMSIRQAGVQGGAALPVEELTFVYTDASVAFTPPGATSKTISDSGS